MSKLKERRREIQGMDLVTAQDELKTLRRQLFDLRIQKERGEVKDTRQFAKTKNDIARILYHIGELHHEAAMEAEGMEAEGLGEAEAPTATEAPAATPRATRRTTPTAAATAAPAATPAAGGTAEAATASASAGASEAPSVTSVPLPEADLLETPELPAPTGGSEDQEK